MRYLKSSYVSAVSWKDRTGSGILATSDERSVKEYINNLCPHFDLLTDIFGQRKNVTTPFIYESEDDVEYLVEHLDPNLDEQFVEVEPDYVLVTPNTSPTYTPEIPSPLSSLNSTQPKSKRRKRNSNPMENLIVIQEKKLEVELQKLELEKEKEKNQVELKKLEIENQFELRKLELEMQIEKL
ncbi:PREDICTED: uncharacterized protein LOC108357386, partial [Rhagoletis zephyria]|uniref:uncharacterized protein LOC108357386 n=1 Tax=Rhagoletis zephyria TaxID=28612 RepID=UPI000811386F